MDKFNEWLENEIATRRWQPSDLARAAHLPDSTISNILNQKRRAGPDVCNAIARALKEPPEKIFRLAGLLPPLPPAVQEEREATQIIRSLPADLRAIALNMLRSLKPPDDAFQPTLAEAPAGYETQGDPFVGVFGELWDQAPDWKKRDIITQLRTAVDEHQRTLKPEKE